MNDSHAVDASGGALRNSPGRAPMTPMDRCGTIDDRPLHPSTPVPESKTTPSHSKSPSKVAKKNARGRRQSHAARLTGDTHPVAETPTTPRKTTRGAEVQAGILHAALECFGAFGFEGTSTRAVAERAGVSHPLLIYHFESKERLWQRTMEDVIGRYQSELDARLVTIEPRDAVSGLRAFIENFVAFSARTPQLHRIMTQQSTQGSERIQWLIDDHLLDSFSKVCDMIKRGQAARRVRKGDPARLYYAVIGLAGTLFSVSTEFQMLTGRDVFSPKELRQTTELIFDFLFIPS